jgi:hypothetical protein
MYRLQFGDGLQFDDDAAFNEEVDSIAAIEALALKDHRQKPPAFPP